jgi:sulfate transport system ATP-binding protein
LHDEINVSCVFVTHDQEEALEVSDRVAILDAGRIEQVGTPQSVYDNPANPFVYGFLGNVNLFHGRVKEGKATVGDFEVDAPEHRNASDSPAVGYSRPHELEVTRDQNGSDSHSAVVLQIQAVGPNVKLRLKRIESEAILEAEITREKLGELELKPGETVFVKPRLVRVFIADPSETRLNYQI